MGKEQELLEAARNGQVDVVEKILSLRLKKVNSLASLRKTPGPNTQDASGYTALHFACLNGHKDVVRSLLQHDANVNVVDKKGSTCLHLAAWAGNYDIVNYILMQSNIEPNVNLTNCDNESPLHCAAQFNHASICSVLLMHGADITLRNSKDETPFDLACEYGRFETVQVLLDFKPDLVYTSNYISHSPLHLAAKNGHPRIIKLLLNSNFDVNCLTENGSALHEAAFYGRQDIVRILLDYGIDTSLVNQQGKNVFDLLGQLNTSVSRAIESIIENHSLRNHHNQMESPLNKSTSLHCILPPEKYCDRNQKTFNDSIRLNSELVAYAAEASQYSDTLNTGLSSGLVQPPKQFAQHSSINYYSDNKFNSSHRPSRRKVSPSDQKLNSNFSRSQDSILDDYLLTAQQNSFPNSNQQAIHKKKQKPQLSTFVQHHDHQLNFVQPTNKYPDDIYSSLENVDPLGVNTEPIYSYPSTCNDQPHSLQNNYLEQVYNEQIQPYSSSTPFDYSAHNSVHNLNHNITSHGRNNYHQKPNSRSSSFNSGYSISSRNSQSHHQLNYLNNQKIYASNINYPTSHDSGQYSMATYQTIERDYSKQDHSFCDYPVSNQSSVLRHGGMKRSTSNTSDSYLDNLSVSSSKDLSSLPVQTNNGSSYSAIKRYSSVVDELKTNRLRSAPMETVQRIKVNSNDLYAQVDKGRKNSLKGNNQTSATNNRIQNLLEFYDQPSKLIKKVTTDQQINQQLNNQNEQPIKTSKMINHMTNEQLELYAEIEKKVEKSSKLNKLKNDSFDQTKENLNLRSQATFVKAKLNREKRATIAITLNETEMDELNKFEAKPPDAKHAANQISKILKPIHENYKKMKLKPNKQTSTDEKQFNRFLAGKKMVIIEKNLEERKILVDKSVCTEETEDDKTLIKKDAIDKDRDKKIVKPKTNDLIDLEELKILEDKFNEIKSTKDASSTTNSSTIKSNVSSTVNSMNRPRRQAPPPPLPKHAIQPNKKETDTLKSMTDQLNDKTNELNDKLILDKIDKNLSAKERDLLTKSLNLPLNLDWKHDPLILYKQTCHYLAFYLGTSKIKNVQGALSSQQCIRDYRELLNDNKLTSLTAVILSISYKSVRCVDVNCQKILNEHEIRKVHYACQDIDQFRFFAYVTKDAEDRGFFNCHVFSACSLEMTSEILLTLAQAFEIAFRINNNETIDQLRKNYVKSKLTSHQPNNRKNQSKLNNFPSPPLRNSSYSLDRNQNLSKSLSESQFNQLLISVSNGFRSNCKINDKNESKDELFRPKQVISASNSIKSIKSVKSESNFVRRKSLQSNQMSSLNHLNHLNNLIKPIKSAKPKPPLKHQTSLPETKRANNLSLIPTKPMIPVKPQIKRLS